MTASGRLESFWSNQVIGCLSTLSWRSSTKNIKRSYCFTGVLYGPSGNWFGPIKKTCWWADSARGM